MIALVALGYTMVYGVLKLINFAHSEVFMMSAYFGLILLAIFVGDPSAIEGTIVLSGRTVNAVTASGGVLRSHPLVATALATVGAMLLASTLGILVERAAYRPLR